MAARRRHRGRAARAILTTLDDALDKFLFPERTPPPFQSADDALNAFLDDDDFEQPCLYYDEECMVELESGIADDGELTGGPWSLKRNSPSFR